MVNIIIGIACIVVAMVLLIPSDKLDKRHAFLGIIDLIIGSINLGIGIISVFCLNATYIVTINRMDGTSIEVETQNYNIDDGYVEVKQDNSNIYIYDVKDITVIKKDK